MLAHCQAAADADWPRLRELAGEQRASRETRELRQESRQMGYSLEQLLSGLPELDDDSRALFAALDEPGLAAGWALAARAWRISPQDALAAWLWGWLENQLAVLMKTLPLGQQTAQRLPNSYAQTRLSAWELSKKPATTVKLSPQWPGSRHTQLIHRSLHSYPG